MAQEASTSKQNPPLEHFQNKKFSLSSLMLYLQISLKFFFSHLFHLSHWRGIPNSSLCIFSNLFPLNFAIHTKKSVDLLLLGLDKIYISDSILDKSLVFW